MCDLSYFTNSLEIRVQTIWIRCKQCLVVSVCHLVWDALRNCGLILRALFGTTMVLIILWVLCWTLCLKAQLRLFSWSGSYRGWCQIVELRYLLCSFLGALRWTLRLPPSKHVIVLVIWHWWSCRRTVWQFEGQTVPKERDLPLTSFANWPDSQRWLSLLYPWK